MPSDFLGILNFQSMSEKLPDVSTAADVSLPDVPTKEPGGMHFASVQGNSELSPNCYDPWEGRRGNSCEIHFFNFQLLFLSNYNYYIIMIIVIIIVI